nr:hypothetical protein [Tanacetum cinerariifolium]
MALIKHYRVYFSQLDPLGLNKVITFERHPDIAIDDPRPVAGSFSMADVRRLRYFGVPMEMVWRLPFYYTPPVAVDVVIPNPTLEDLAIGTPSSKILDKAEAFQNTNRPSLFVGDSDDESNGDEDSCVEIPLVTPLCSTAMIPSSGNQGRSSTAPAAEGPNTRDSRGKGIMADDAAAPSFYGVTGNYEFTREEWDALYRPTFGVLTKKVFKDPAVFKTVVDQFPTLGEMSPSKHPNGKSGLDASAKLTRAELNKCSGDADLSKDKSGPESPPEF